jgi:hypothetical protein
MSEKPEQTRKIVLKKNKAIDKIWHPDSTLVFKSPEEKLVIGRLENGQVLPLDDVAIELCEEWKFKYDETLLEPTEQEQSDQEQSEQEGDETDEENEEENEEEVDKPQTEDTTPVEETKQEPVEQEPTKQEPTSQNEVVIDSMFSALQSRVLSTILALEEKIRIQTQEMTSIKKELEDTHTELKSTKTELEDTRNKLQNIKKVLNF